MRWILLAVAALALDACAKDQAQSLSHQMRSNGGVAYDVRSVATAEKPDIYEALASYSRVHASERTAILNSLLYRGVARLKADGYEYVLLQGPIDGQLVTTIHYAYGAGTSSVGDPMIKFVLTGFKAGRSHPAQAVEAASFLEKLRSQASDI
jgi:hypothetical protein